MQEQQRAKLSQRVNPQTLEVLEQLRRIQGYKSIGRVIDWLAEGKVELIRKYNNEN